MAYTNAEASSVELGRDERKTLAVHFDMGKGKSKTYHLPLLDYITVGDGKLFNAPADLDEQQASRFYFDAFLNFVYRYIPQEIVDAMTYKDLESLSEQWNAANEGGATTGE